MNRNNENYELNREQHQFSFQIQDTKLKKVLQGQRISNLNFQIRGLDDVENQLQIINDFSNEITQHGQRQRNDDHTVFSILCGCDVWPNLVCCVAETVKGRHEVTEMMADRYKVSINRLKMKFEACPSVSIQKALQTKNGEILTDIEENDANISTDRDIVDQLELVNQRFVQEAEQTNRKWGTRLKAMQQELEQHERGQQSQEKTENEKNATTVIASPLTVVASPCPTNTNNDQQMHNDDDDLTFSPITINEYVELLSSQLSESSIHEENPVIANEQAKNDQASALSYLIQHPNVQDNDELNVVIVDPMTPKRVPPKIRNPPAKKPCYGEPVLVQAGTRGDSNESFRRHHQNGKGDERIQPKSSNSLTQKPTSSNEFSKMPQTVGSQSSNTTMKIDRKQSNSTDSDGQKHETVGDSMAMFGNRKTNDKIQSNFEKFGGPSKTSNLSAEFDMLTDSETASGIGNHSKMPVTNEQSVENSFGEGISTANNDATSFGQHDDFADDSELAVRHNSPENRDSALKHVSIHKNIVPNASGQNNAVTNQPRSEKTSSRKTATATVVTEQIGSRSDSNGGVRQYYRNDERGEYSRISKMPQTVGYQQPSNASMEHAQKPSTSSNSNGSSVTKKIRKEDGSNSMVALNHSQRTGISDERSTFLRLPFEFEMFDDLSNATNVFEAFDDSILNSNLVTPHDNGKNSKKTDSSEQSTINFPDFDNQSDFFNNEDEAGAADYVDEIDFSFNLSGFGDDSV